MTTPAACQEVDCAGAVAADGYCDTCGMKSRPVMPSADPGPGTEVAGPRGTASTGPSGTLTLGSAGSEGRRRRAAPSRASTQRTSIGAGIIHVPSAPHVDPATAVLADPSVDESKRFCSGCDAPVGRSRGGTAGRLSGFCPVCGERFDFRPKLAAGETVGGQYEVVGCLAHGGLGWIYLARDRAVNDQWVVLKGLLNATDQAALAVAVAEKRFLADTRHANIVDIYNFVPHRGAGYIVMEYVSGPSLKQMLVQRREAGGGQPDPLPVDLAIAYVLAVLPAFSYLHDRGLVYCDFKLDNAIHSGDRVKLIDLGAVRRLADTGGDIFGTTGFQAPEVPELGVSISSDLYTIGRTLAVLTLDFRGYQTAFQHSLPDPADHPVLARFDSFHRFLLKATAPHPDDRFQTAVDMGDQLLGVLREVVALTTEQPEPAPSKVFAPPLDDEALPPLAIDAADAAATFLANLPVDHPAAVLAEIDDALTSGQVEETIEIRLRKIRALIDSGDHEAATALLDSVIAGDPWEWRAVWLRGISALATNDLAAAAAFDRCWSEVPGELAPKVAAALTAEAAGDLAAGATLHGLVVTVDPSYIVSARGLARCRVGLGDVDGALAAYDRIPGTHRAYAAAQEEAVQVLIAAEQFPAAYSRLVRLDVDDRRRAELDVELFAAALPYQMTRNPAWSRSARVGLRHELFNALVRILCGADHVGSCPAGSHLHHGIFNGLAGLSAIEITRYHECCLRSGLEDALRRLARLTPDASERCRLADHANSVRPLTLL